MRAVAPQVDGERALRRPPRSPPRWCGHRPPSARDRLGVGGSSRSTSSSRHEVGTGLAAATSLTSRTGASARATRSDQPSPTTSGRTPSTGWLPVPGPAPASSPWTAPSPPRGTPRAAALLGVQAEEVHPYAGPSCSSGTTPGSSRSPRAPSSTTSTGANATPAPLGLRRLAPALERRRELGDLRPMESRSVPTAATAARVRRTCGSHRTHDQSATAVVPSGTAGVASSSPATGPPGCAAPRPGPRATSRRPSGGRSAGPATPTTRSRPTLTGTSGAVQRRAPWWRSRLGSLIRTSVGWSAVPTRALSQSGSTGRRSHSRARGPVACSSTAAGSGKFAPAGLALGDERLERRLLDRRGRRWCSSSCSP